jgi:hypothetical protein
MDYAELIVSALAAGASSGITEATASAVGDAYANLRDLLRTWLVNRRANWDEIGRLNASDDSRQRLLELLRDSDPEQVSALAAAADRVLLVLDPHGHRAGRYSVVSDAESVGSVQQTAHAHDYARVFQVGTGTMNINDR